MRRRILTGLLPWAVLWFMAWAPQAVRADVLTGKVVAVADGDTVTVMDVDQNKHKIRLAGIDAPESRQPYGQRSRQSLSDLVSGQWVQVVYDKADRYGRLVGKVQVAGRDANLEQLRRGLAWHYKKYEGEQGQQDRQAYAAAEQQAQSARLGLWRDPGPQAPWDYRQLQRRPEGP
jgi:endonuclease YncB( thermonuclease family)